MMQSSKRARIEEGQTQTNLFNQLPDDLLVEIFSYLPTTDVMKMAPFFPRFRSLLAYIRRLSFDECTFHDHRDSFGAQKYDERFLNLIHRVLKLHERTTIDEFHLRLSFSFYFDFHDEPHNSDYASKEEKVASELTSWIDFSLRKKVKVLDIDLLGCGYPNPGGANYELPESVLTNDCLMELSLAGCGISERSRIQLMSLTKLSLKEIKLSDEIMGELCQGCPVLEELFINECPGLRKLNLTHHSNIKRLKIFLGVKDDVELLSLEISCSNIKSLELAGALEFFHLNASCSFSEVSLYFSRNYQQNRHIHIVSLLALLLKVAEANVFIPCTWTVMVLTIWMLSRLPTPVFGCKSVEFRLLFTKVHLPGICSILKGSKHLESLTFYIYPAQLNSANSEEELWEMCNFEVKDYLESQNDSFRCKTINIYGYVTEQYVLELIEFLLKNALVLERMVISTKRTLLTTVPKYDELFKPWVETQKDCFPSNELHEFFQKLLSLPRASQSAVIQCCF